MSSGGTKPTPSGGGARRYSDPLAELKRLEALVDDCFNKGRTEERNEHLLEFCRLSNQIGQSPEAFSSSGEATALDVLKRCVEVLERNSNRLNAFNELFYETYNNMARLFNMEGDIPASLGYLKKAMVHVERLEDA